MRSDRTTRREKRRQARQAGRKTDTDKTDKTNATETVATGDNPSPPPTTHLSERFDNMAGIPVVIVGELTYQGLTVGGGPMPGGPGVSHPIAPGGKPPGIWGGGNEGFPTHPIVIPPGFIDGVHPEHPIVIPPPQQPPGIWGGRPPEYIDIGLPGPQPHPEHPIVIPPDIGIWPPDAKPEHPIVIPPPTPIWPPPHPAHPVAPGGPGKPTHPIVLPPDGPPEVMANWEVVAYWTEEGGWAIAVVPVGDQPVPTPSSG